MKQSEFKTLVNLLREAQVPTPVAPTNKPQASISTQTLKQDFLNKAKQFSQLSAEFSVDELKQIQQLLNSVMTLATKKGKNAALTLKRASDVLKRDLGVKE